MKLATIRSERVIAAPASRVWSVLADEFDKPDHWAAGITGAEYTTSARSGIGMARRCDLDRGKYMVEQIDEWNDGRSLSYRVIETNLPVRDGRVTWTVVPVGPATSSVTAETTYRLKHGIAGTIANKLVAQRQFQRQFDDTLIGLERYATTQVIR